MKCCSFRFACKLIAFLLAAGLGEARLAAETKPTSATPADQLQVLPGFKVELLHSAATNEGSWICMAADPKGRLIISPQQDDRPLLRVTLTRDGQVEKIEPVPAPLHQAMGMCYAHDSLYVNGHGPNGTGLYRLIDANHNDQFDTNEVHFLKKFLGEGEHGYHAVVEGPDGMIYVMNGNHTPLPKDIEPTSPHRNFQEDILLPRQWDANGHAVGIFAPGGQVLRTDPEGKKWELMFAGFRNCYDFDFNADGEIFTFDSDMEWDWGLPWYRPIRIIHCVTGGDYGWRSGSGKWPEDYPDSLPPVLNVGIGSPTGVKFGTRSNFPEKYRRALFLEDWAYGRIFIVYLKPQGASYSASMEVLLKGRPLNLTALRFGKDGALYFITGGRGTQSGLYRVSYVGSKLPAEKPAAAEKQADKEARSARVLRHQLESYAGKKDPRAIDIAWPYLGSPDRFIRHAARIAIESQDVALWKNRALAQTDETAALTALLALARCGGRETQNDLLRALKDLPYESLTEEQKLDLLRVVEISFIRQGRPEPDIVDAAIESLGEIYPGPNDRLNRELVQLLVYLGAPDVVGKTMDFIDRLPTQENQIHYLFALRNVNSGWTLDQRRQYFEWFIKNQKARKSEPLSRLHDAKLLQWFADAGREYSDGASFPKYLANIRADAIGTLTADERSALQPLLQQNIDRAEWKPMKERKFVRSWKVADIEPVLAQASSGRDFKSAQAAFNDSQCVMCHRFRNEGGSVGPELTGVGSKYSRQYILESIIEPSKVIADQYQNVTVLKKDSEDVTGRIIFEDDDRVVICPSMLAPQSTVEVRKADIARRLPSPVSPMPTGLLNQLTEGEILDLLAYLETGGNEHAANFQK